MTEAEWLACTDVLAMLDPVVAVAKDRRRLRLFSIACCRRLARWVVNQRLWKCLDASERYADGKLKDSGLAHWTAEANRSWLAVDHATTPVRNRAAVKKTHHAIAYTCLADSYGAYGNAAAIILRAEKELGKAFVAEMRSLFPHLLRDVFGNPFRPPARFDPAWRTKAVVGLAEAAYADRQLDSLPILADALEDAGCDEAAILEHCRDPGQVHVRGCWVIDLARETHG